jgi:hypothetical protein
VLAQNRDVVPLGLGLIEPQSDLGAVDPLHALLALLDRLVDWACAYVLSIRRLSLRCGNLLRNEGSP